MADDSNHDDKTPTVNKQEYDNFTKACLEKLQCTPHDIFSADTKLRAEPRECSATFSPTAEGLKTLTSMIDSQYWEQPRRHEKVVLALQYASMLRRNDHRPWHYIYTVEGDEFIDRMSEILRASEAPGTKTLSSRDLVQTMDDKECTHGDYASKIGWVLRFLTVIFDEEMNMKGQTIPSAIEGNMAPDEYESTHSDWKLVCQVILMLETLYVLGNEVNSSM